MSCPCGLTRGEVLDLDRRERVPLVSGKCQNPLADGTEGICGKALGAHISSQATLDSYALLFGRTFFTSIYNSLFGLYGYEFNCIIKFAKNRRCCRFRVYQAAESCLAYQASTNTAYGIFYQELTLHLVVRLIFKEESKALEFESLLRKLPRLYRRRTPHDESIITDITVNDMKISSLSLPTPLTRVYETDYNKIADDTNPSDDCDTESNYSSSVASPVSVNEESRLRLVDNESSHNLFYQKPEKCHLLSQKKFPKEKNDPNNVVFMCRLLHQHFDGIDSVEGIPTFIMKYVSHSSLPSPGSVNGKTVNVYETIVKIVFKNQELKDELSKDFKDYTVLSSTEIQFSLCSPDPVRAKRCIESKAEETQMIWNSYDGSIS